MSDRIYSAGQTRSGVEGVSEEAIKLEKMQQLSTDIKKDIIERPPTRIERKFKRIFGAAGQTSSLFVNGFKMGALVGGAFGGVLGTYQAIQMRSFMVIPLAAVGSGFSFGCCMGLGMMIRTSEMWLLKGAKFVYGRPPYLS